MITAVLQDLAACIPSQCAVCRRWPSAQVCNDCFRRFAPPRLRCRTCALAMPEPIFALAPAGLPVQCARCARGPLGLDACFAALPYAFPWSGLVARYKFGSETGWARFMAAALLEQPGVTDLLEALTAQDLLVPVPLSAERLGWRGFNQAWMLAKELKRQSQCHARTDAACLLRIRHTRPQSELKRSDRLANLQGAFAVEPLRTAELQGRDVVLVDDVMTSGASLLTAAQVLRQAGVRRVSAIVLARTAPS
jgi:ComF family protein